MNFYSWKNKVISLLRRYGWNQSAIETIDWAAWYHYFDAGLSPAEAISEDMLSA